MGKDLSSGEHLGEEHWQSAEACIKPSSVMKRE